MCLIAFAIDPDAAVPLLIASNRDEFFDRPTQPLHRWVLNSGAEVVGGRDLREGGTWLGLSAGGRVAMLTNVRGERMEAAARSRGELTSRWLAGTLNWAQLLDSLSPHDYGGFNLVVGDAHQGLWGWVSNRDPAAPHGDQSGALHSRELPAGLYGLSNATLDTGWPKTLRLKQALGATLLLASDASSSQILLQALGDTAPAGAGELPETGVPLDWEQPLSSPFVDMPERGYGTRSTLLVRATRPTDHKAGLGWHIQLDEWTHGTRPQDRAVWREDQRRTASLIW